MSDEPERLLTAKEVADILRVSVNALTQLRFRGSGPRYIRFGRSVRYRVSDVNAYIKAAAALAEDDSDPS